MNEAWEPASLGDERLDGQHRQLVRRLEGLAQAISTGHLDEIRVELRVLSLALTEHWKDEERWMEDAGYPAIAEHSRIHDRMLRLVTAAIDPEAAGIASLANRLAREVDEHMRVDDLKLARFFAARANLRRLAEARPGRGPALTPLPGVLTPVPGGMRTTPLPTRTPAAFGMTPPPGKKPFDR